MHLDCVTVTPVEKSTLMELVVSIVLATSLFSACLDSAGKVPREPLS